jgi:tRNA(Ile)-lysidine synthase
LDASVFSRYAIESERLVAVAVSGGGDSMALLFLAARYLEQCGTGTRLLALTVDHALRPDSAAEAAAVAAYCRGRGIMHRTLSWEGPKPQTGLAAAARAIRYQLLAEAAAASGARIVLVGHTADDQCETVAMRRLRGVGPGLAGIAPATLHVSGIWFVRPLLEVTRQALRDLLGKADIGWIEDPSNRNPAFERARLRSRRIEPAARQALLAQAKAAACARQRLAAEVAGLVGRHVRRAAPGLLRLDPAIIGVPDREAVTHMLRLLLAACGGRLHLPRAEQAETILEVLAREEGRATLSRTLVEIRGGCPWLLREGRGIVPVAARAGAVFDGRFLVLRDEPGGRIAPLGAAAAAIAEAPPALVGMAAAREPGLWRNGSLAGPAEDVRPALVRRLVPPWQELLPSFDFAAAQALAALLGTPPFPLPPWTGHNFS